MAFMASYKPGQGKQARTVVALCALFAGAWASYSLMEYGNSKLDRLIGRESPLFSWPLFGEELALTSWITPSLILALALFIAIFVWAHRFLNRPNVADHLIGTELELRRVTWPTKPQVSHSAGVVMYYTFLMALAIFILDLDMASLVNCYVLGQPIDKAGWGNLFNQLFGLGSVGNGLVLNILVPVILALQVIWGVMLWRQRATAQGAASSQAAE